MPAANRRKQKERLTICLFQAPFHPPPFPTPQMYQKFKLGKAHFGSLGEKETKTTPEPRKHPYLRSISVELATKKKEEVHLNNALEKTGGPPVPPTFYTN